MPPPESKKPLGEAQKQLLKRWIEEGAEYKDHWAFIAPKRPDVPAVSDKKWVRNPIDAFILARLDEANMKPSPEASRETLLRRVSFDLTGLPPTLEEIDLFSTTRRCPTPTTKPVDRLLALAALCRTDARRCPGSTRPAMPTPTATTTTRNASCGHGATG